MSQPDEGWSTPSLYSARSRVIEPRVDVTGDPMSTGLFPGWDDEAPPGASAAAGAATAEPVWSSTTYVGRRAGRVRAATAKAAQTRARSEPAPPGEYAAAGAPARPAAGAAVDDAPATAPPREPEVDERSNRGLLANSRSMAVASLTSRITGFLRTSLLAAALGVGHVGDAYNVANNLPNMVYELLLGGVLSSVLIPLLVHAQEQDDDDGVGYIQRLMSIATAALAAVTVVAVLCAPLLAGAFIQAGSQRSLASVFAALLLPEIFFYGIGALFMAVLNIRHSYAPGAWSPVLNNVVMISTLGIFWALPGPNVLTPDSITTTQTVVLGVGTTLGIAAQALVLIPALRVTGFRWRWRFRSRPHEVGRMREVGTLAFWVLGYVVASQIGVSVIAYVGGHHRGAFTVFTYADLLIQMPYGILVVSLLTALMPRLSRAAARDQRADVVADLGLGARLSAVALLPITAGLIVLGPALTTVLFAYGETSISGARTIGVALAASAFGLFPFALVMLQLRVFYAMRDGRTPTLINICMVATKVVIVLVCAATLTSPSEIAVSLTVGTSASYVVGAAVGYLALRRRLGRLGVGRVAETVMQLTAASLLGGAVAWVIVRAVNAALGQGRIGALTGLLTGALGGLAVLAVTVWRLRVSEVRDIVALARG